VRLRLQQAHEFVGAETCLPNDRTQHAAIELAMVGNDKLGNGSTRRTMMWLPC